MAFFSNPGSVKMVISKMFLVLSLSAVLGLAACSRQQTDWEKTRTANTTDAYELFLKKYPSGEFTAQAQARVKELYEERDWQKARDTDTLESYQAFLKQYPEGKWTEEARIRVENFTLASAPSNTTAGAGTSSSQASQPPELPPAAPRQVAPKPGSAMMRAAPPKPGSATIKAAPAPKATAATKSTAKSQGAYGVQLGAFKSGADAANQRWTALEKQYPKVLSGLSPKVSPKKGASGTLYRLQVASLSQDRANSICKALKAGSQACVLLQP
jgi:cell division protein FtsN